MPQQQTNCATVPPGDLYVQGCHHEVLFEGGRIHGHPNPPTPKIHFLLGFRPLYFENVGLYLKKLHVSIKKLLKYHNFGGTSPADFSTAGDVSPRPPLLAPMLTVSTLNNL